MSHDLRLTISLSIYLSSIADLAVCRSGKFEILGESKRKFQKKPSGVSPALDALGDPSDKVKVTDPQGRVYLYMRQKADGRAEPAALHRTLAKRMAVWALLI